MSKYALLGFFFTVMVVLTGGLMINHQSNTNNMREITVGLESVVLGDMRSSESSDGGLRAKDIMAEVTKEIALKQADNDRIIVVSFDFYGKDGGYMDFQDTVDNNEVVHSIQYKVDLYGETDFEEDGKTLKPGVKPQTSTENHITLNRNN